jgi:hypothetical protein
MIKFKKKIKKQKTVLVGGGRRRTKEMMMTGKDETRGETCQPFSLLTPPSNNLLL